MRCRSTVEAVELLNEELCKTVAIECSQPFIFSYLYSIVKRAHILIRERTGRQHKGDLVWPAPPRALSSLCSFSLSRALENREAVNCLNDPEKRIPVSPRLHDGEAPKKYF